MRRAAAPLRGPGPGGGFGSTYLSGGVECRNSPAPLSRYLTQRLTPLSSSAYPSVNGALPHRYKSFTLSPMGRTGRWRETYVADTTLGISAPTSDDGEVLISRSTWSLRLSGLLFAGLLVVGRAASGGQIVWLPAYHANPTPLIVVINTSKPATPPAVPKTLPDPAAAISKKSAASEVITFSPGKNSGKGDGLALPDASDSGTSAAGTVANETGSSDNGSGGSVGTAAAETGISDV